MTRSTNIPAIAGGVVFVLLAFFTSDASVLPALLMVAAVLQGLYALAAAAHLAEGKWILPARKTILSRVTGKIEYPHTAKLLPGYIWLWPPIPMRIWRERHGVAIP